MIHLFQFQSLIRTAEQLKIKGLCEINDHNNTNESDTEIINYPPHKKSRTSRKFENNNHTAVNRNIYHTEASSSSVTDSKRESNASATVKNGSPIVLLDNNSRITTQKSNNAIKSSNSSDNARSNNSDNKNMASLDMGMVGIVSIFNQI